MADIVVFLNIFIFYLILVNSEKSCKMLEPVQRDRRKFVLPKMISGGLPANPGCVGLPKCGSVIEGFYFLPG